MVQLLGALTGCVQHVCTTQESIILENIHSLPSSVLHVIKSTFVHCKVSNGSKYTLNGLESMSKGPELVVFMFVHGRRQWHPTPVLLPGKSHGWRSLVGCSPWGR